MIDIKKLKIGDKLTLLKDRFHLKKGEVVTVKEINFDTSIVVYSDSSGVCQLVDYLYFDYFKYFEEKKMKEEFKLGKYKTPGNAIVDVIAVHNDMAWCFYSDRGSMVFKVSELRPIGKFEHLRGLPVDTKVIVWDDGDIDAATRTPRHFKEVSQCGNYVHCFIDGMTSFSVILLPVYVRNDSKWENCEIWQEENPTF